MTTLAVDTLERPDMHALAKAAHSLGWRVTTFQSAQTLSDLERQDLAIHGPPSDALAFARRCDVALLEPSWDWLLGLPDCFRLRRMSLTTVREARTLTERVFVKTLDPAHKHFDAGVFPGGWALPWRRGFPEETPALVAEAVEWLVEYRCFVSEGRVAALSPYARGGRWMRRGDGAWSVPVVERAAMERLVQDLTQQIPESMPAAVTIDLGLIARRGWAVIESNPVWSSGLYQCDPTKALSVLRRACVPREQLNVEERRWVRKGA